MPQVYAVREFPFTHTHAHTHTHTHTVKNGSPFEPESITAR